MPIKATLFNLDNMSRIVRAGLIRGKKNRVLPVMPFGSDGFAEARDDGGGAINPRGPSGPERQ
jgi:hypothetical protein